MNITTITIAALLAVGALAAIGQSAYALDYIHVPGTETIRSNDVQAFTFHDSVTFRDQTDVTADVRFTVVDDVDLILIENDSVDQCLKKKPTPSNHQKFIPNSQRISIHDSVDVYFVWYDVYDIRYVILDGFATLVSIDNVKTKCIHDTLDFEGDPVG